MPVGFTLATKTFPPPGAVPAQPYGALGASQPGIQPAPHYAVLDF